ncbi:alpha/beta fold hydrolase [Sandaracinobacteroides hominis]|uniref:alpha/beta fold hydrolase n=1 Tax=Sandaracinobacteroides hominis TaxID=2780086 RepID=UPI0018F2FF9B|nr:alpha/beta hydrolase [Sandaracinobacteroides hominis]
MIHHRQIPNINGLDMHVLEAGDPANPAVLLLHGFPELAYSWRKIIPRLANAGYHVIAPDQRGYGRTTGEDRSRLEQFRILNIVRDAMGLVSALGRDHVAAVVGHDFGSPVAGWAAMARPDIFRSCVLMSAPFPGAPPFPFPPVRGGGDFHAGLEALGRKHYQWYYSTDAAAAEMDAPKQGMAAFLRAYYHVKSADWAENRPYPLAGWSADELAKLPDYYVMPRELGMTETVAPFLPETVPGWLSEAELEYYTGAYMRTGFGGGLLWYRAITSGRFAADFELFAGRRIEVPTMFLAGASDWGIHQNPGAYEAMAVRASADWRGSHLLPGAGHWVQQEQPEAVAALLLEFLKGL